MTAGLTPDQFWSLTPYMTGLVLTAHNKSVAAQQDRAAWHTWHVAALTRCKRMPSLKKFMHPAPTVPKTIDEIAIKARLKAYQHGPSR